MAMVKVFNDNKYPYKENFKGENIVIEPGKFITMDYYEAIEFRGTYSPIRRDANEQPMPTSFKMIRIDDTLDSVPEVKVDENKCLVCNYKAASKADLDEHMKLAHADQAVVDQEAEAEIVARRRGRPARDA